MSLATTVDGIELEHPLMNAAGTCKTLEQVERFMRSTVSAVVIGPITPEPREGNSGTVYWQGESYSLNSLGMPNIGCEQFFETDWRRIQELAQQTGKPVILQIAGFNLDDYVRLARMAERYGVKHIEFNFGCPNVWEGDKQERIVSFDPPAIVLIIEQARRVFHGTLGIKLSPYSDPFLLDLVAKSINDLGYAVSYVACSNTFPNALILDPHTGKPVISVGAGLAGMSGRAMKPIALGQVHQFADRLKYAQIVGVGGITTGQDILDFIRAGAKAVQASTVYWNANEDPGAYGDVIAGCAELLGQEG